MNSFKARCKILYRLTKPGIIYGNALPMLGAFGLGVATTRFQVWSLVGVAVGQSLIIASGCVANNVLDRGLDARMSRTKNRALVTGAVSVPAALVLAAGLLLLGVVALFLWTNWVTLVIGLAGWVLYVGVYDFAKRHTPWGTLIGCIPGALPPVAGYTACTGRLDWTAGLLFLVLVCWQMSHFYAIGLYRRQDYRDAGLPIWPVVKSAASTKRQILLFCALFTLSLMGLAVISPAGWVFGLATSAIGLRWLWLGVRGFKAPDNVIWGKRMFRFSLLALLGICALLPLGPWLP